MDEGGRYLIVTNQELLSSVFFEVRVVEQEVHPEFLDLESIEDFLARPSDNAECESQTIRGRQWATCQQTDCPATVVRYSLDQGFVYEVASTPNSSLADEQAVENMFGTLQFVEP